MVQLIHVGPSYAWNISDFPHLLNCQQKSSACVGELAEMIRTSKIISPLTDSKVSDWYPCWHHPQSPSPHPGNDICCLVILGFRAERPGVGASSVLPGHLLWDCSNSGVAPCLCRFLLLTVRVVGRLLHCDSRRKGKASVQVSR